MRQDMDAQGRHDDAKGDALGVFQQGMAGGIGHGNLGGFRSYTMT
jgi:hypothetical protein